MRSFRHTGPLIVLALVVLVAVAFRFRHHFAWSELAQHHAELRAFVAGRPILAAVLYVGLYIGVVTISLPVGEMMTIAGGLLFGTLLGAALAVIGATCGAVMLFLLTRSLFGDTLRDRAGPLVGRIREGLERDGFSYLLAIRLVPLVPFWVANLAPALVGMRLAPYAAATFIGVIPVTLVFTSVGSGLQNVLGSGERPHLHVLFTPQVLLPLLGLALVALVPVAWKHLRAARA